LAMNDEKVNSSAALIEEAKKERQRLPDQIEQSQRNDRALPADHRTH
jgi:hypothetical protein